MDTSLKQKVAPIFGTLETKGPDKNAFQSVVKLAVTSQEIQENIL